MIENFFDQFLDILNIFDTVVLIIMVYSIMQCFLKGFSLSFISFMKWVFSVVITIVLVNLNPLHHSLIGGYQLIYL